MLTPGLPVVCSNYINVCAKEVILVGTRSLLLVARYIVKFTFHYSKKGVYNL